MVVDYQEFPLLFTLLRRWWWLILLSMLLSLAASYAITKHIKPTYEASAQIYIDAATVSSSTIGTYTDRNSTLMLASTVADMINSYRIAGRAVATFHLDITPSRLLDEMTATAASDTPIVTIQVDDSRSNRAAQLANAAAATIIAVNRADQRARFGGLEKTIRAEIAATTKSINKRNARIRALTAPGNASLALNAQISNLSQEVNALQTALSSLNAQLTGLLLSQAQSATTMTILDNAQVPSSPVQPSTRKNLLLGLALGLFLASAIIALLTYLSDPVRSSQAVEQRLKLPVLGSIPPSTARDSTVLVADSYLNPGAEAYKLLRTTLMSAAVHQPIHRLLIVSGSPGEGKSTIASNLAVASALTGRQVVLVDTDLRRPRLHHIFATGAQPDLVDVLHGAQPTHSLLHPTHIQGLRVVCGGQVPPNPSELLSSSRMREFLKMVSAEADLVILDSPPALLVSDASVLAGEVDGVLMVVDNEITSMRAAERTLHLLKLVNAPVVGVVINRRDAESLRYGRPSYASLLKSLQSSPNIPGTEPIQREGSKTSTGS